MQKKRSLHVLGVVIFVIIAGIFSGTASAITGITSDISSNLNGTPVLYVNQGGAFSITFTAQNPIGTVTWNLGGAYSSDDVSLSTATGNTTTLSGTLTQYSIQGYSSNGYSFAIAAYDDGGTTFDNVQASYSFMVLDSSSYGNGGNVTPVPGPVTSPDPPAKLETAIISPVPSLTDDVISRLAQNISVDPSEIILLTSADFTTSDPPEPTQAMRQEVSKQNGQFLAKLNTITVSRDGWYVFMVTVSDDLVGTPVNDLRLFGAEGSDFSGSFTASFGLLSVFNGVTGMWEVSNLFGWEIDTLPKQFLVTMLLSAGTSLTTYFVKILLMLLAGGCSAGIGIGAVCATVAVIADVKSCRKKDSRSKQE